MPALGRDEVVPGLVVRLDTARLRAGGGSRTNAQSTPDEDRAVTDVHDFLVLLVDARASQVTAIPLFPRSAPGSAPLDDRLRTGPVEWLAQPVYYSRWQHWQIPVDALVDAALVEPESPDARRTHASGNMDALQDLANWASRNRCTFREVR